MNAKERAQQAPKGVITVRPGPYAGMWSIRFPGGLTTDERGPEESVLRLVARTYPDHLVRKDPTP